MEEIKRWLRVVGVPTLFLLVGFVLGLMVRGIAAPSARFVTDTNDNVLDTKTGQYCVPVSAQVAANSALPRCLDLYRRY